MSILAINAGSSSLKFGLYREDDYERVLAGQLDWASGDRQQAQLVVRPRNGTTVRSRLPVPDHATAAACAIEAALRSGPTEPEGSTPISLVGHRVVHGGTDYRTSVVIDEKVKRTIARLCDLAPLHNPPALKAIEAAEAALPGISQVAVFDTAFYAQLPPKAYLYAVPYHWHEEWGIRRFGFHGISHAYCASRASELLKRDPAELRIVTCHLGGGCTATAVRGGAAVATTGGFTPLDGLMMGTRSGSIDPGILLHLQRQAGLTCKELSRALTCSAGLLGLSGFSADLSQIEVASAGGNERARMTFELFADQVRGAIAALAASMSGLDAVTFTDRMGEGSPGLRAAVCEGLQFMGVRLDPERNAAARADCDISASGSGVRLLVIHTEEELMVARESTRVAKLPRG